MVLVSKLAERLQEILLARIEKGTLILPPLPRVAMQVQEQLNDPNIDINKIGRTLERDPTLTAHVLRLANSAMYAAKQRIDSISKAVAFLGLNNLRNALLTASTRHVFVSQHPKINEALGKLWEHSVAVAFIARDVAGIAGAKDNEVAYVSGLLHDVGKVVVATYLLDYESTLSRAEAERWIDHNEWLEVVQGIHQKIGGAVAQAWKLPDAVVNVISQNADYDAGDRVSPTNAVRFANALAKREGIFAGPVDVNEVTTVVMIGTSILGLDDEVIKGLLTGARKLMGAGI